MLHSAFLFDHEKFRQYVVPIIQTVDQGVYDPLYVEANKVFSSVLPEDWVLYDQGTMLERFALSETVDSSDVGYLFLVILSTFLQKAPSLGSWGTLIELLKTTGWTKEDAWLVMRGNSPATILQPECQASPHDSLELTDPYWYWVMPTQAYQCGWLSCDEVCHFGERLASTQNKKKSECARYLG
jgi:hypothetical protein